MRVAVVCVRHDTFVAAEAYVRDAKAQLLRGSLLRYDQVQKGGGGGGGVAVPAQGWGRERAERRDRAGMWPELQNFNAADRS